MSKMHNNPETEVLSKTIKYMPGSPRQYRFNAQTGRFNINGIQDVGDRFSFQPIAWRIFEDDLFARGRIEAWAELFFVDRQGAMSSLMFNNSSVYELRRLMERLFYDDLKLSDVVLKVTSEKKVNEKVTPKGTWYLAVFEYEAADPAQVVELTAFAQSHPIYRAETLTRAAEHSLISESYAYGLTLPGLPVAPLSITPKLVA
ncbi:hypothetical protein HNQ92_005237 [Rhabdobacter roseus]|jgi:hypothetical protein|uniref:Uncharacterized protein n=1 Tax=Rhabdobacter roseus TaxID=1655419 RepID=A0A840TVY1_9BACT|nr:hypothetical protein [Rhabdobacter roseus]MBB5287075.1 hypothetical protein [Rhabdobacter roseus]